MDRRNLLHRMAEAADLPMEPIPGVPLIEIAGTQRVLIENHHGVFAYSNSCICVKVAYGYIQISGLGLELVKMTAHQLIIGGKIQSVELKKGACI